VEDDRKAREQVDRVFKKLDLNQDGVITIEEFIESCLKVEISIYFILQLSDLP
jgi:Ca2+-binding EF-hand superfamily protein